MLGIPTPISRRDHEPMDDATTLLFALPGYRVLDVSPEPDGGRRVLVETEASEAACPGCGVFSRDVHERPVRRGEGPAPRAGPPGGWGRQNPFRLPGPG